MLKIYFWILSLSITLFAYSQSELIEMAKANPALLNTPQAKEYLKSHNINSVNNSSSNKQIQKTPPTNEIVFDDFKKKKETDSGEEELSINKDKSKSEIQTTNSEGIDDTNNKTKEIKTKKTRAEILTNDEIITNEIRRDALLNDGTLRMSPLQYKSDDAQIKKIKSIQVHRGKLQGKLERFSKEFFRNKNKIYQKNISVPNDYTLNRGDTIRIWIYGKDENNYNLTVNSEGNIDIPQIGPVRVAGENFLEVKKLLTEYLSSSYKNSRVVVSLEEFSNAQVTVTGFVNAPGIYNTTAVSSVKDILIEAGGVGDIGSVRNIEIKRDGTVIKTIDYYSLISEGRDDGDFVLKPGDVIHVPRAYGLVSITGSVYKEAIYEIKEGESIYDILSFAGGLKPNADGVNISLKRYINNSQIQNLTLSINQAMSMSAMDGDEIYIYGLNTTQDNFIMIIGNVVREGKRSILGTRESLRRLLKREIRGRGLNSFFLENTRFDYAMVKRIGKDTKPIVYKINLKDILDGRSDFTLRNRDELYIFNELDTGTAPYVTIQGSPIIKPGKYIFNSGMTITDLINQAGIKKEYDTKKVKIVSKQKGNGKRDVKIIDINSNPNYRLHERDSVTIFAMDETHPTQSATISGEVVKPGTYAISDGMTLADFIKGAGGLNERAYPIDCEIIRYYMEDGERKKRIINLPLDQANTFLLKKHDEIRIKRAVDWDKRRVVKLLGEVKFPGEYVIHSGEKLSSVIKRAGGFTDRAFLYGAIFTRKSVAKLQKEALQKELSKLKEQVILVNVRNSSVPNRAPGNITGILQAVDSLIAESKRFEPKGRITIDLQEDLSYFEGSPSDLTLEDGDVLKVPSYNDTVVVNGEVMLPTALTYDSNNIKDYIKKSGGLTHLADDEHIYVIHANGEAEKANLGSWLFSNNDVCIKRGDVIVVPKKFYYDTRNIELSKDIADIFYKLSLTVAAAHTVGAL